MCLNILIQIASHRDTVRVADVFPDDTGAQESREPLSSAICCLGWGDGHLMRWASYACFVYLD